MEPLSSERIVPLIVATALFMENIDSTVIATSLPAIARALDTNPLALKLAVTSYLLSLAIGIPASGWTADRFGTATCSAPRSVCSCSARSAAPLRTRSNNSSLPVSSKAWAAP